MKAFRLLAIGLFAISFCFIWKAEDCRTKLNQISVRPIITHISWGRIRVKDNDKIIEYKDAILFPTGSVQWDWSKTGTKHNPGIQIADLKAFINQADIFILSRGMDLVLQVKEETKEYLKNNKKEIYILQTKDAVEKYNQLVNQNKKVVALIHSTC